MCPPGNVACPNCGSDRCECPSGPGPSPSPDTKCSWEENMNSYGNTLPQAPWSEDPQACCNHCGAQSGCVAWTFIPYSHECWLKSWVPSRDQWSWDDSAVSGQIGAPSLEAATEETTMALPASEDVNTTAGVAHSSSSLQGLLSETIYCNPYLQQMCPPGNVACPQCGSERYECPSGPGPSPSPGCDGMRYTRNYAEGTEHECRCDNYCDNFCDDDPNSCARTCRILNGVFEHTPSVHAGDRTCAWQAYSVSNPVNYQGYDCSWMVGTGEDGHGDNCQDFSSDGAWKCREGNQNQNNCRF